MKKLISKLHYKKYLNPLDYIVLFSLLPFAFVYGIVSSVRNLSYKWGLLKKYKPKALCISVGNITTGGVGKTPIVKELAEYFIKKGKKVAILSRGYGSELESNNINVISDGKDVFYTAKQAGDEPYWLAQNCAGAIVLTCKNRVEIAKFAVNKFGCNVLILDDGFQHQRLARDVNILVIDYEKQLGNKLHLPAGPLREYPHNIKRANCIIVVNKTFNTIEAQSYCEKLKKKYKKNVILVNMDFDKIYSLMSNIEVKKPKKLFAFCAIGQPEQFFDQIKENGLELVEQYSFDDHHIYTIEDLQTIADSAEKLHCDQLITTEKDAVKIKNLLLKNNDIDKEILVVKLKTNIDMEELFNEQY